MKNINFIFKLQAISIKASYNLMKAFGFNPNITDTYVKLGILYERMGDYDKAIDYAQKAILLDRNNAIAIHNLGCVYIMQSKKDLAIEQYEKLKTIGQEKLAYSLMDEIVKREEEGRAE